MLMENHGERKLSTVEVFLPLLSLSKKKLKFSLFCIVRQQLCWKIHLNKSLAVSRFLMEIQKGFQDEQE